MRRFTFKTVGLIGAALIVTAGIALATPGLNVTPGPLTRSSFIDDVAIKIQLKLPGGDVFTDNMRDPSEIITQEITIAPGGHTGWHSHPGPVIVQVRSGTLTYYAGDDPTCTGRPYAAGTAFVDPGRGHVHIARNESTTTPLNFVAIYFDVPPGASPRIDAPAPGNCSF